MGKSRPYITNCLRLLNLPPSLSRAVEEGSLSQGHARLLLTLKSKEEQEQWYQRILSQDISVRKLEQLLKPKPSAPKKKAKKDIFKKHHEDILSQSLGLPVSISFANSKSTQKGEVVLHFQSEEDFNRIINKFK